MNIRTLDNKFRDAVNAYIRYLWGGPVIVSMSVAYDTSALSGFVAEGEGALLGAALYRIEQDQCEVSALFSLIQGKGVGTALLNAVKQEAARQNAKRLWLITTNDDTNAIRFYQRYGFSLKAVHIGAFETTRKIKKELPALGDDGIPIEHEFEFEMIL